MRTVSARPSVWHVIVTLIAMYYLSCGTGGIISAVESLEAHDVTPSGMNVAAAIFGLLIVGAWIFLTVDLIKQVALFFRKARP